MSDSNFAKRLRDLLKKARLTQQNVADALDVPHITVWRWLNERATPESYNMQKLADLLHISLDELLNGKQETGTWQLRIEVANDFRQEVIDVSKNVPRVASIQTTPNGGFLVLGGDYSLWQDDNSFKRFIADLKKYRSVVIQNGVALGGIKN